MGEGYVLDFSNRTFSEFFIEHLDVDIYDEGYSEGGNSKANRLRSFWRLSSDDSVARCIDKLLEHITDSLALGRLDAHGYRDGVLDECRVIASRLAGTRKQATGTFTTGSSSSEPDDGFDLAFSFAGEDRAYVETVKEACERLGLTVYYDRDRRIDQWGKSFVQEQRRVYGGYRTKHFVPFISRHYFAKSVPTDEFKSALMHSLSNSRYILPIKLDDSAISTEYLHEDTQYLSSREFSASRLAYALKSVVDDSTAPAKEVDDLLSDELQLRAPKLIPRAFSKFEAAEELVQYVWHMFESNLSQIGTDFASSVRLSDDRLRIIVERDGRALFAANLFFSSMGENVVGYNFDKSTTPGRSDSQNGHVEPLFEQQTQQTMYLHSDYSSMGRNNAPKTKAEIMTYFWEVMLERLERH